MRAALAFLTPLGGARVPDRRTLDWFPLVGALLGGAVGTVWWGAAQIWPPAVAAGIALAADLALTAMLHFDGLVDAADGLLPHHLDRGRRLEIMAEPTVGAFGIAAGGAVLLLRFAAFASSPPSIGIVAALWCIARTLMAVAARSVPVARPGGLVAGFGAGSWQLPLGVGAVISVAVGIVTAGLAGAISVAVAFAAGLAVVAAGRARLGGCTGDVLGAAGIVAETAGLLAFAARWP